MEISEIHIKTFFGKNSDYYFDKWNEYKNGRIISFRPFAFLFGLFWFLYRKMYREGLLMGLLILIEGIIEEYILTDIFNIQEGDRKGFDLIIIILIAAFSGMFGNYIYMKSSERKIKKILSTDLSEEEKMKKLEGTGGTSWIFFIVVLAIIGTIICLINLFEIE